MTRAFIHPSRYLKVRRGDIAIYYYRGDTKLQSTQIHPQTAEAPPPCRARTGDTGGTASSAGTAARARRLGARTPPPPRATRAPAPSARDRRRTGAPRSRAGGVQVQARGVVLLGNASTRGESALGDWNRATVRRAPTRPQAASRRHPAGRHRWPPRRRRRRRRRGGGERRATARTPICPRKSGRVGMLAGGPSEVAGTQVRRRRDRFRRRFSVPPPHRVRLPARPRLPLAVPAVRERAHVPPCGWARRGEHCTCLCASAGAPALRATRREDQPRDARGVERVRAARPSSSRVGARSTRNTRRFRRAAAGVASGDKRQSPDLDQRRQGE